MTFCFPIEVLKKGALILHKHECLGDIYDENGYKKLGDMDVLKMISLKNNFLIDLIMSFSSLKINVQILGENFFHQREIMQFRYTLIYICIQRKVYARRYNKHVKKTVE